MFSVLFKKANELGFIAIGFSRPERPLYFDHFSAWLSARKNAGMAWLQRKGKVREDPSRLLKGCRTIISLAFPYPSQKSVTPDGFCVARYSHPVQEDYHFRLKKLGRTLTVVIKEIWGDCKTRICVDSAPILERSFALTAGIGFIGKNNMLIIPGYGSYFYLAEILTTACLDFTPAETLRSRCGSCSLCVDSCPTGALEKPFYLDASKCLSYLTIENRGAVNDETGRKMKDCFFGCDRCQEVCPFNRDKSSPQVVLPLTEEFLKMSHEDFQKGFGDSAFARAGLEKLKTNIRAVKD